MSTGQDSSCDGGGEPFLIFGRPSIEQPEIGEVERCLQSGWLGSGPRVAAFERAFADYKGVEQAVALGSCTAALHLSIIAAGLGKGDEVITTAMTFCATVNAIVNSGATPILADVDPLTANLDPAAIEAAITPRTKGLIVVHFAGLACDMDAIESIVQRHGLVLIEDCAHAIETTCDGRPAGTIGDFGCFSFHATKNVTTGEGGMVIARNPEHAARIQRLALHGMEEGAWKRFSDEGFRHYTVSDRGFKCTMMDLQAAIGIHQLARVEDNWRRRGEVWKSYDEQLAALEIERPAHAPSGSRHGRHLYAIRLDRRDGTLETMTRDGIGLGVHYLSIPEHPYYRERFGWTPEQFPVARDIGRRTLSLPMGPSLGDSDVQRVCAALARAQA